MNPVHENIRGARRRQRLTKETLAERLSVSPEVLSAWESGKKRPDTGTLARISAALDTDTEALIYGSPEPEERKRELLRLLAACCVLAALCVVLFFLGRTAAELKKYYIIGPTWLLRSLLLPALWLVLGWTAAQGLRLMGLSPLAGRAGRAVFIAAAAAMALYAAVMLPFWAETVRTTLARLQYMLNPSSGGYYSDSFRIPLLLQTVEFELFTAAVENSAFFLLPGILLRLTKPEKRDR